MFLPLRCTLCSSHRARRSSRSCTCNKLTSLLSEIVFLIKLSYLAPQEKCSRDSRLRFLNEAKKVSLLQFAQLNKTNSKYHLFLKNHFNDNQKFTYTWVIQKLTGLIKINLLPVIRQPWNFGTRRFRWWRFRIRKLAPCQKKFEKYLRTSNRPPNFLS